MNILYTVKNNSCSNSSDSIVTIDKVSFANTTESTIYNKYMIIWSTGNFSQSTVVSTDGKLVKGLPDGQYSFQIFSLINGQTGPTNSISISSPPELIITDVRYSRLSCDSNGVIEIDAQGGTPPYSYSIGTHAINSSATTAKFMDLDPNSYDISVQDSKGCTTIAPTITIKNGNIKKTIKEILPPKILDDFGFISLDVQGYGPFDFKFKKDNEPEIFISKDNTNYLIFKNTLTNTYSYEFSNLLSPGDYTINIISNSNCSLEFMLSIPNILPISLIPTINQNSPSSTYNKASPLFILDTLLIPFNLIKNDLNLYNFLLTEPKDIQIYIDNILFNYQIVRKSLKIQNNKIDILKLGNDSDNWYYYLHISPSFDINVDSQFLNSSIDFRLNDIKYKINLTINNNKNIDNNNISMIRGSLILNGNGYATFKDNNNAYVSLTDKDDLTDYDYEIKNINKIILKTIYSLGFVTTINFLNNPLLVESVDMNQKSTILSKESFEYINTIKNLLVDINDINNNDIIAYTLNGSTDTGSINLFIKGNFSFIDKDSTYINNEYFIDYFMFDQISDKPTQIPLTNANVNTSLNNLKSGYYIVRIRDIYNNKVKNILYQNNNINYDTHRIDAISIIENYNIKIQKYFLEGDVLIYIPNNLENTEISINIPTFIKKINPIPPSNIEEPVSEYKTILQTNDSINTGKLKIKNIPISSQCIIIGPQNWQYIFNQSIEFINMRPGVYTIKGLDDYLIGNNLSQNEIVTTVKKGSDDIIIIQFSSL